jgi:hypothetical protein
MTFYTGGSERVRIDTSGNVGIGTTSPVAPLTVASSTTLSAGDPSIVLQGASNTERIQIRSVGGAGTGTPIVLLASGRGTIASPTVAISGDDLGGYQMGGYNGTTYRRGAWMRGLADGDHSATNSGTVIQFSATPNGSTTIQEVARISSTGLAVTGAVSSTGAIGCAGLTSTNANIIITGNDQSINRLRFVNTGAGGESWNIVGGQPNLDNTGLSFHYNPSGSAIMVLKTTGLAVTGALSLSGAITISGSPFGQGAGVRYISGAATTTDLYSNAATGGIHYWAIGESIKAQLTGAGLAVTGALSCTGALSKGSGSFRIEHPLPEKSATHQLVHSFIEGPQADLIYRGKVVLVEGKAFVNIDAAATMTEGTFEVLCREVQCFTTNESGWTAVRGKVTGNILTIEAKDADCSDEISWMVIGERQDPHMMETDWTDDNGKVIVEPLKPSIESN